MTREEAKEIIGAMSWELYNQEVSDEKTIEALNMAIEALEEKYPCGLCKYYEDKEDWGVCQYCPAEPKGSDTE